MVSACSEDWRRLPGGKGTTHWTAVLFAEDQNPRARLATEILASPAYDSTAARVKAFTQQGGGCRATFFNYQKRLQGGPPVKQG